MAGSTEAAALFGRELGVVGVKAQASARAQVSAAVRSREAILSQVGALREMATNAKLSYRERTAAANLAAEAELRLAKATATSAREQGALFGGAGRQGRRASEHGRGGSRLRERFRLGNRIANVTGFGPVSLGLGGFALAAYKGSEAASKFQAEMELVRTQAGGTQREVGRMSAAIMRMSADVGQSPEKLARGIYHIESAGIRGSKALRLLRAAAEGAAVGHADLEAVTNALVAASKSHIAGVGSQVHGMSVLNAIVGAGNMRMNDLAGAITTGVLPAARNFGLSIQDVGAALAVMTRGGVPAEQAATRLRMTFSLLGAPTAKAQKQLALIGLSAEELGRTIRSRGLFAGLQELKHHLDFSGLDRTDQAALLSRAFGGGRSSGGLMTLIQNLGDFKDAQTQIARSTGQFGASWVATQHKAQFATERFKAAVSVLGITLGSALLPTVTRLMTRFAGWVSRMEKSGKLQREVKHAAKELSSALHTAAGVIQSVWNWSNKAAHALGGWKNVIKLLIALKVAATLLRWRKALIELTGAKGLGGLLGASSASGGLLKNLRALASLKAIKIAVTVVIAYEFLKGEADFLKKALGLKDVKPHSGGDVSGPFGLGSGSVSDDEGLPVWRHGKWVSPITGKPNPNQAYWNRQYRQGNIDKPAPPPFPGTRAQKRRAASLAEAAYRRALAHGGRDPVTGYHYDKKTHHWAWPRGTNPFTHMKALPKGSEHGGGPGGPLVPYGLTGAVKAAQQTKSQKDDLLALRAEEHYLRERLAHTKRSSKLYGELGAALAGVERQIATARKRAAGKPPLVPYGISDALLRARLSKGREDDLRALEAEEHYLRERLAHTKRDTKLYHELLSALAGVDSQIASIQSHQAAARKKAAAASAAARNARQYRFLGLGPDGSELAPTKRALKSELANVSDAIKGTFLETGSSRSLLSKIRRLLAGQMGALSSDMRTKLKELLDNLKSQLNQFDGFNLTRAERRAHFHDRSFSHSDRYRQHGTSKSEVHHHQNVTIHNPKREETQHTMQRVTWRLRHAT